MKKFLLLAAIAVLAILAISCNKDKSDKRGTTPHASCEIETTSTTALIRISIENAYGDETIKARWSLNQGGSYDYHDVNATKVSKDLFTIELTGLEPSTWYLLEYGLGISGSEPTNYNIEGFQTKDPEPIIP